MLVVVVLGGVALIADSTGSRPPSASPANPTSLVAAADAESSAWYCTGQSTQTESTAVGSVDLTNTTDHAISGTMTSITDTGVTVNSAVSVPARAQIVVAAPASSGYWISESVVLSGGGVAVSQLLHGPSGWDVAPCQSTTSQQWYFPSGTTSGSSDLFMALFNPTSTPDVVDLTFVTPVGIEHPISFQGIVLEPGQTQVEDVGTYVQNQRTVATTVAARTGRVVASETQVIAGAVNGLANIPGSPNVQQKWALPLSQEVTGGSSSIDVYNPGSTVEDVTVRARLSSGPLPVFEQKLPPGSTWTLVTSAQTRIPKTSASGGSYTTTITATGGPGVVIGRSVAAPNGSAAPQAGAANAIDGLSTMAPSHQWVLPSPGTSSDPAVAGAAPAAVALSNPSATDETYVISVLTPSGLRVITRGRLPVGTFIALGGAPLTSAGLNPLIISATGSVAVSESLVPSGGYGVVTMPGIAIDQ